MSYTSHGIWGYCNQESWYVNIFKVTMERQPLEPCSSINNIIIINIIMQWVKPVLELTTDELNQLPFGYTKVNLESVNT